MIAIDTNVLVRYLVNDEPRQSRLAKDLVESALADSDRVWVGTVVLVETLWALERAYSFNKTELISVLEDLMAYGVFALEDSGAATDALESYRHGKADFSDYLFAWKSLASAKSKLYTFDGNCREKALFAAPG